MDIPLGMVGRNVRKRQNPRMAENRKHPRTVRIVPCAGFLFDSQRDGISEVRPRTVGRSAMPGADDAGAGRAVT